MLVNSVGLNDQGSNNPQAILTRTQTIFFNFNKRADSAGTACHPVNSASPLLLYIGMKFHTETRSKKHNYTVV